MCVVLSWIAEKRSWFVSHGFPLGFFSLFTEGPQAMLRGAVLYGGLMYLVSGNLIGGNRRKPFQYEEEVVEF